MIRHPGIQLNEVDQKWQHINNWIRLSSMISSPTSRGSRGLHPGSRHTLTDPSLVFTDFIPCCHAVCWPSRSYGQCKSCTESEAFLGNWWSGIRKTWPNTRGLLWCVESPMDFPIIQPKTRILKVWLAIRQHQPTPDMRLRLWWSIASNLVIFFTRKNHVSLSYNINTRTALQAQTYAFLAEWVMKIGKSDSGFRDSCINLIW